MQFLSVIPVHTLWHLQVDPDRCDVLESILSASVLHQSRTAEEEMMEFKKKKKALWVTNLFYFSCFDMNAVWKDSVSFLLCTHSQTCFPSVFVSHSFFLFFLNECISLQFVTPLTIYGFLCARVLTLLFSVPCWTLNSKYNMAEWRHMTGTNPNRHNNFLSVTRWGKNVEQSLCVHVGRYWSSCLCAKMHFGCRWVC